MVLDISVASFSDMSEMGRVCNRAFLPDDALSRIMMGNVSVEAQIGYWTGWFAGSFHDAGVKYFKMVDSETGEMVGFSRWVYPHDPSGPRHEQPQAEGANLQAVAEVLGRMDELHKKWIDDKIMHFVNMVGVIPEYRGKGVGKRIMEFGLADADRDGARTFLEASPLGIEIYRRLGFKEIGDMVDVDMTPYGENGRAIDLCMIREPVKK